MSISLRKRGQNSKNLVYSKGGCKKYTNKNIFVDKTDPFKSKLRNVLFPSYSTSKDVEHNAWYFAFNKVSKYTCYQLSS